MAKVVASPSFFTKIRKVNVTTKVLDQTAEVAIEAARPRTLVGKISKIINHGPGPNCYGVRKLGADRSFLHADLGISRQTNSVKKNDPPLFSAAGRVVGTG
jgi:hypothetical protein